VYGTDEILLVWAFAALMNCAIVSGGVKMHEFRRFESAAIGPVRTWMGEVGGRGAVRMRRGPEA
jgi:hypothetical protein